MVDSKDKSLQEVDEITKEGYELNYIEYKTTRRNSVLPYNFSLKEVDSKESLFDFK